MNLRCLCSVLPPEYHNPEESHRRTRETLRSLLCFCPRRNRRKTKPPAAFFDADGVYAQENVGAENPRVFSYSELYIGSDGFHESQILGSGGFGRVYHAVLPSDGTAVAVKCLAERGESFRKTFMAELVAVAHLRHRNLVRLRGWCARDDELLLVYDYMPNRSLDRVLFPKPGQKKSDGDSIVLTWERRKKIVTGLSTALNYIHEELETQIIHRDVKSSNVMLDSGFNARLGDFGLARWLEHDLNLTNPPPPSKNFRFRLAETTGVGGTIGYLPPESLRRKGSATAKSDVFSFGIVLLEVVSGRRAVDLTFPDDEIILLDWIRRLSDEGNLVTAVDSRFREGSFKPEEINRILSIGLMCTFYDPESRPTMKWVSKVLSANSLTYKLPDLPSFRFHPPYISISYPSTTTTNTQTQSSRTTTSTVITTSVSSGFVSANEETIYFTAESETSNHDRKTFPVIETPRVIPFDEIVAATNNFSDSHRAAEVDFGTSYHGFLNDHHRVIIKRLGMKTCPALRIRFANELQGLGRLRHRNLIQLRGWCTEHGEMLVVYDYSPNFLLGRILFDHSRKKLLWHQRCSIIRSLASAVCYLHDEWDEQVIHRNITSSAIFLDHDMNPRLGSFALAEFLTRNEHSEHVVVDEKKSVRGIFGYMSPEYVDSGKATTMADVYSFGVVMLEVVTGRMAVDFRQRDVLLVKRVHKFESEKRGYGELVDRRLDGEYDEREMTRLVKLGLACTRSDPGSRPSMRQIVSAMDGCDQWMEIEWRKEGMEEWKRRNEASLSLVRRIQALTIQ